VGALLSKMNRSSATYLPDFETGEINLAGFQNLSVEL
jgi:hypothetical protein